MKILMTLLVRNELDIIGANLDYHLARGVDFFLVMDHMSTDGTLEVLEKYRRAGVVDVFPQTDPGYYQGEWVTAMARLAATRYGADWVINSDADEFWWPTGGDLKSALAEVPYEFSALAVARHNFRPVAGATEPCFSEMVYRDVVSTNSLGQPLPDKVCHRGSPDVVVSQGNHSAWMPNWDKTYKGDGIEILHFPVRSLRQIKNKITLGGRAYEVSDELPKGVGHTWRSLYDQFKRDGADGYFQATCLVPDRLSQEISQGRVVQDKRLHDFMASIPRRVA